ncbi:uncharacterized protein BJ171DRAFT_492272 [Polychytrium aggregatum]|uniref:uncharacterized protein n=1 Tax=Polychytrium aggregatum TaxID=110093 RepID=UPI0022FEC176|nr:uncharacterized protein BJ171DRAFT_492272 [Polychytrium aggregatum]KAI9207974.1 hypothetical protein BJ171DRAFT_492272 [Polychytrium aggregatum]
MDAPEAFPLHGPGHTEAVFNRTGDRLISCGQGRVAIHSYPDLGGDPLKVTFDKSSPSCLAVHHGKIVVGMTDGHVGLYNAATLKLVRPLARLALAVTCLDFHPSGDLMAVGAEDGEIRLINTDNIKDVKVLSGHAPIVRSVAFNPKGTVLASSSSDGSIRIWNVSDGSCMRTIANAIAKTPAESHILSRIAWKPDGSLFAIPGKDGDILMFQTDSWIQATPISHNHDLPFIVVAWSGSGEYLAAAALDGYVGVWRAKQSKPQLVSSQTLKHRVTSLAWNPSQNALGMATCNGYVHLWSEVIPAGHPEPFANGAGVSTQSEDFLDPSDRSDLVADKGIRDQGDIELEEQLFGSDFDEDEPAEDDDNFVVDDDGAGYVHRLETSKDMRRYYDSERTRIDRQVGGRRQYGLEIQAPFQPSSTTLKGDRKYLAVDLSGVIYAIQDKKMDQMIHLEFFDKSRRSVHFSDDRNFSMAVLGTSGAAFASETSGSYRSTLMFKSYDTWGGNSLDWKIELPAKENIKALAMTASSITVFTDQYYLRHFSHSGLQLGIQSLKSPVVAMSGWGNVLVIARHEGGTYHGEQNLGYLIISASSLRILQIGELPISPNATLQWIGFSELGMPATYDSQGIMRILERHKSRAWVPVFDAQAVMNGRAESYFAVGVTETQFICVVLKGKEKHPSFPRPTLTEFPIQIQFIAADSSDTQLEERLFRSSLLSSHAEGESHESGTFEEKEAELVRKEADMDKILIQLMQGACTTDPPNTNKFLELCSRLHLLKAYDAAAQLALYHQLHSLSERVAVLKERKYRETLRREQQSAPGFPSRAPVSSPESAAHIIRPAEKQPPSTPKSPNLLRQNIDAIRARKQRESQTPTSSVNRIAPPPQHADADANADVDADDYNDNDDTVMDVEKENYGLDQDDGFAPPASRPSSGSSNALLQSPTPKSSKNPFALSSRLQASSPVAKTAVKGPVPAIWESFQGKSPKPAAARRENEHSAKKKRSQPSISGVFRKTEDEPLDKRPRVQDDIEEDAIEAADVSLATVSLTRSKLQLE